MKFEKVQMPQEEQPKLIYRINVETMEGDADDWHNFDIDIKDEETLKEVIIYCEVMAKQYPHGRGGGNDYYDHLDFFDEWFNDEWFYEDGEWMDSWENYSVSYFDENGVEMKVNVTLEQEDIDKINQYEVRK